ADTAEDEFAVREFGELAIEVEDDADRLRGEVLDRFEVEDEQPLVLLVDQLVQRFADVLEIQRVHEGGGLELDDREFLDGADLEGEVHSSPYIGRTRGREAGRVVQCVAPRGQVVTDMTAAPAAGAGAPRVISRGNGG